MKCSKGKGQMKRILLTYECSWLQIMIQLLFLGLCAPILHSKHTCYYCYTGIAVPGLKLLPLKKCLLPQKLISDSDVVWVVRCSYGHLSTLSEDWRLSKQYLSHKGCSRCVRHHVFMVPKVPLRLNIPWLKTDRVFFCEILVLSSIFSKMSDQSLAWLWIEG